MLQAKKYKVNLDTIFWLDLDFKQTTNSYGQYCSYDIHHYLLLANQNKNNCHVLHKKFMRYIRSSEKFKY